MYEARPKSESRISLVVKRRNGPAPLVTLLFSRDSGPSCTPCTELCVHHDLRHSIVAVSKKAPISLGNGAARFRIVGRDRRRGVGTAGLLPLAKSLVNTIVAAWPANWLRGDAYWVARSRMVHFHLLLPVERWN
jgi:hypothetical protein